MCHSGFQVDRVSVSSYGLLSEEPFGEAGGRPWLSSRIDRARADALACSLIKYSPPTFPGGGEFGNIFLEFPRASQFSTLPRESVEVHPLQETHEVGNVLAVA